MSDKCICLGFVVALLAAVGGAYGFSGCGDDSGTSTTMGVRGEYTADWSTVQDFEGAFVTNPASGEMSEGEYKGNCSHVSYKDFENDTEAHKGEDVYFIGPVTVVGKAADSDILAPAFGGALEGLSELALGMGPKGDGGIGPYETAVIVVWPGPLPEIPKGSIVAVWGESQGAYGDYPQSTPEYAVVRGRYLTWYLP